MAFSRGLGPEDQGLGLPRGLGEEGIASVDQGEGFADEFAAAEAGDFQLAALVVHLEDPDFPAQ